MPGPAPLDARCSVVTVDCWGTLLAEPASLAEGIDRSLRAGLLGMHPKPGAGRISDALCDERRDFARALRAPSSAVRPLDRLTRVHQVLSGEDPADGQIAELSSILRAVDAELEIYPPHTMPMARELLERVSGHGIPVYLISNTGWLSSPAVTGALAAAGLLRHIKRCYFSDQGFLCKPAGQMFHLAVRHSGAVPGEAVHIGDQLAADGLGALAAGFRTVIVVRGEQQPDDGGSTGPEETEPPGTCLFADDLSGAWEHLLAWVR